MILTLTKVRVKLLPKYEESHASSLSALSFEAHLSEWHCQDFHLETIQKCTWNVKYTKSSTTSQ